MIQQIIRKKANTYKIQKNLAAFEYILFACRIYLVFQFFLEADKLGRLNIL